LVTNAGPDAENLFLPAGGAGGASAIIGPNYNFNGSGDYSIEVQFENTTNQMEGFGSYEIDLFNEIDFRLSEAQFAQHSGVSSRGPEVTN
jgi:hypothetical protein